MPLNLPFLTKDTARKDAKQNKINQFISEVKTGALARSNRFGVEFSPPAGINPGNLRKILLFCDLLNNTIMVTFTKTTFCAGCRRTCR